MNNTLKSQGNTLGGTKGDFNQRTTGFD